MISKETARCILEDAANKIPQREIAKRNNVSRGAVARCLKNHTAQNGAKTGPKRSQNRAKEKEYSYNPEEPRTGRLCEQFKAEYLLPASAQYECATITITCKKGKSGARNSLGFMVTHGRAIECGEPRISDAGICSILAMVQEYMNRYLFHSHMRYNVATMTIELSSEGYNITQSRQEQVGW